MEIPRENPRADHVFVGEVVSLPVSSSLLLAICAENLFCERRRFPDSCPEQMSSNSDGRDCDPGPSKVPRRGDEESARIRQTRRSLPGLDIKKCLFCQQEKRPKGKARRRPENLYRCTWDCTPDTLPATPPASGRTNVSCSRSIKATCTRMTSGITARVTSSTPAART